MDISDVIKLSIQAADSVLRFRTIAFGARTFIDLKIIKTTLRTSIRSLAKDKGYSEDMPLASVVDFAGTAAFRAAKKWNAIADKTSVDGPSTRSSHVDGEWFRHCLCDLVRGVVTEIGHQAHQKLHLQIVRNDLNEFDDEYLDPLGGDDDDNDNDDDDSSIGIVQQQKKKAQRGGQLGSPPSTDGDGSGASASASASTNYYYGLQGAPHMHSPDGPPRLLLLPPHHQITAGWAAVSKYAANPLSSSAAAECQDTIISLTRPHKRASPAAESTDNDDCEIGEDGKDNNDDDGGGAEAEAEAEADAEEEQEQEQQEEKEDTTSNGDCAVVERVAKKRRIDTHGRPSRSPATTMSSSPTHALGGTSYVPRKAVIKVSWTRQEEELLVKSRDEGKSWNEIQDLVNRHTRAACDRKYRTLDAKRREQKGVEAGVKVSAVGHKSHEEGQRMPRL